MGCHSEALLAAYSHLGIFFHKNRGSFLNCPGVWFFHKNKGHFFNDPKTRVSSFQTVSGVVFLNVLLKVIIRKLIEHKINSSHTCQLCTVYLFRVPSLRLTQERTENHLYIPSMKVCTVIKFYILLSDSAT